MQLLRRLFGEAGVKFSSAFRGLRGQIFVRSDGGSEVPLGGDRKKREDALGRYGRYPMNESRFPREHGDATVLLYHVC
jgi:hypothetical protein